jgi:hypothetical protein
MNYGITVDYTGVNTMANQKIGGNPPNGFSRVSRPPSEQFVPSSNPPARFNQPPTFPPGNGVPNQSINRIAAKTNSPPVGATSNKVGAGAPENSIMPPKSHFTPGINGSIRIPDSNPGRSFIPPARVAGLPIRPPQTDALNVSAVLPNRPPNSETSNNIISDQKPVNSIPPPANPARPPVSGFKPPKNQFPDPNLVVKNGPLPNMSPSFPKDSIPNPIAPSSNNKPASKPNGSNVPAGFKSNSGISTNNPPAYPANIGYPVTGPNAPKSQQSPPMHANTAQLNSRPHLKLQAPNMSDSKNSDVYNSRPLAPFSPTLGRMSGRAPYSPTISRGRTPFSPTLARNNARSPFSPTLSRNSGMFGGNSPSTATGIGLIQPGAQSFQQSNFVVGPNIPDQKDTGVYNSLNSVRPNAISQPMGIGQNSPNGFIQPEKQSFTHSNLLNTGSSQDLNTHGSMVSGVHPPIAQSVNSFGPPPIIHSNGNGGWRPPSSNNFAPGNEFANMNLSNASHNYPPPPIHGQSMASSNSFNQNPHRQQPDVPNSHNIQQHAFQPSQYPPTSQQPGFSYAQPGMHPPNPAFSSNISQQSPMNNQFQQPGNQYLQQGMQQNSPYSGNSSGMTAQNPKQRIDPDQIPSAIEEQNKDQKAYAAVPFVTSTRGMPPYSTTNFRAVDEGNCNPRFIRSTLYNIPTTDSLLKSSNIPLGIVVQPLADLSPDEAPIPVVGITKDGPVRCSRCLAYVNPNFQFINGGKLFICNLCSLNNPGIFCLNKYLKNMLAN